MPALASEAPAAGSLATVEKGGATFEGLRLLLCENPLPPLDEAIAAAREALPLSNYYTEPYSAPLRSLLARLHDVPERLIHINAGSELILRHVRVDLHVHVAPELTIVEAHRIAEAVETRIRHLDPGIAEVLVHLGAAPMSADTHEATREVGGRR